MAETDLISDYLTALRGSLRWRADVDDLVSEADDHLRSAAERARADGLDAQAAQRHVIDRFGDAALVARAFALAPSGGIAMPTPFTRMTGTIALVGAAAWLITAPIVVLRADYLSEDWEPLYFTVAILMFVGATCTTLTYAGLLSRTGGARDVLAILAIGTAALGTLFLAVVTWAWIVGVGLLTVAALIPVLRLRDAGAAPRAARVLMVAAWPVAILSAIALDALQVGPVDSYGDYFLAQLIGLAVGCVLFGIALIGTGRWLRSELPARVPAAAAV